MDIVEAYEIVKRNEEYNFALMHAIDKLISEAYSNGYRDGLDTANGDRP